MTSATPLGKTLSWRCLALGWMILFLNGAAPAAPPEAVRSYKQQVGDFVFVMLAPRCVNVPTEVTMRQVEFEAIRTLREESREHLVAVAVPGSDGAESPLVSCLHLTLSTAPEVIATEDDLVRVSMPRFERVYDDSMVSESGVPYTTSGLYRSDGTAKPLWTVSWYAAEVRLSLYNFRLVRLHPEPAGEAPALSFYRSGELVAELSLRDLDRDAAARSHTDAKWYREATINDDHLLRLTLANGQIYLLNLANGRLIKHPTVESQAYTATVYFRSGSSESLRNFRACAGDVFEHAAESLGAAAATHFYGFRQPHHENDFGHDLRGLPTATPLIPAHAIPFVRIDIIERVEQFKIPRIDLYAGMDDRAWAIRSVDGKGAILTVDILRYRLCGTDEAGRERRLALSELDKIELER